MNITIRPSKERGYANHGWLEAHYTFSFADYYDPMHMAYHSLRVINEDRIAAGRGFGAHPHTDMEIITLVLEGALEHKDSMGNTSIMRLGDVQRMSAGKGVQHSEYNHSKTDPVHLYQIWILPDQKNLPPSYEQRHFAPAGKENTLRLIASPSGAENSVSVHQDILLYDSLLDKGADLVYKMDKRRAVWVQVKEGQLKMNGLLLKAGDGAAIEQETKLQFTAEDTADFILFDLA